MLTSSYHDGIGKSLNWIFFKKERKLTVSGCLPISFEKVELLLSIFVCMLNTSRWVWAFLLQHFLFLYLICNYLLFPLLPISL